MFGKIMIPLEVHLVHRHPNLGIEITSENNVMECNQCNSSILMFG